MITTYIAAAIGGVLGTVLRHFFSRFNTDWLPYGTLIVNILGSFLLGFFFFYFESNSHLSHLRALVVVGFAGALTTYSTLNLELFSYLNNQLYRQFLIYSVLNGSVGVSSVFLGKLLFDWTSK